jgi:tetratricopeptide (TPR) repeat protein
MARIALAAAVAAALTSTGCVGLFGEKQADTARGTAPATGTPPGLLIGPEAAQNAPPTELPPKQAAVACLHAADEMALKGKGADSVKQSIALYEKARALDPAAAAAAGVGRKLAVLYDLTGDFSKAQAEYEPLLKATPNDATLLNDVGYSYYSRGDLPTAEGYLSKAVQADPTLKAAWLNLGLVLAAGGRLEDGFDAFLKAGTEGEALANMAFVLAAQGNVAEAKAQYKKALALEPGMTAARTALERLENPPKVDPTVTPAGGTGAAKRMTADDIPNIHELEQRLQKDEKR